MKKPVKGRKGYLYTLEAKEGMEPVPQSENCVHSGCYRIKDNLKVLKVEYVDAYEELQKYIKNGELKVVKFEDLPKEYAEKEQKKIVEFSKENFNYIRNNHTYLIEEYLKEKSN